MTGLPQRAAVCAPHEPVSEWQTGLRCLRWPGSERGSLVLLHGMGDGADVWRATVAQLRHHYRGDVIAIDLAGHWGSEWRADGLYTLDAFVQQIAAVIAALSSGPTYVVGHSLGGRIAAALAGRSALNLGCVILVDMSPTPPEGSQNAVFEHIEALNDPPFDADRLAAIAVERLPFSAPDAVEAYFIGAVAALGAGVAHAVDPLVMEYDMVLNGKRADFWEIIAAIPCPVGIVRGAFSGILSSRDAHGIALRVQNCCGYHTIGSAGHAIPLEQPASLADRIAQCLSAAQSGNALT